MDVIFLVSSHLELVPDILSMVQTNMDDNGCDRSK
jgi:hypothetical protein